MHNFPKINRLLEKIAIFCRQNGAKVVFLFVLRNYFKNFLDYNSIRHISFFS